MQKYSTLTYCVTKHCVHRDKLTYNTSQQANSKQVLFLFRLGSNVKSNQCAPPPFGFKYHLYLFTCLMCCHYYMCITCREMNNKPKSCDIIFCSIPLAVLFAITIILYLTNVTHFCFKYYILFVHVLDLLSLLYVYYL